ncbi:MAG: hypothetical protein P8074_26965 [Anaerolineales bacterium]
MDVKSKGRFDRGSWAVLLLALGFITGAVLYLVLAYQQPSDGWVYETRLDGQYIAVGSLVDEPGPLQAGDTRVTIAGKPVASTILRPLPTPPGWQIGGTVRYSVQRAGKTLDLQVPLIVRPLSVIFRIYDLTGTFLLTNLLWYLIGFIVFFLRPRETAARLLLLFSTYWMTMDTIVSADASPAPYYYPAGLFWANILLNSLWLLMFAMIIHFALVFPLRKWPLTRRPRLTLALLYGVPAVGTVLALSVGQISIYNVVLGGMILAVIVTLITTTIHNLRNTHDPVARAQIGWVALGISAPLAGALLLFSLPSLEPNLDSGFLNGFDIQVIIRRTLVYTTLTLLLAAVYFGGVTLMQTLFTVLGGSQSTLATVISTLGIAALFNPLRHKVQDFIDRRFYRRKYDAERALAQFAITARDEVDQESLTAALVGLVQETIQPEKTSLWLKKKE